MALLLGSILVISAVCEYDFSLRDASNARKEFPQGLPQWSPDGSLIAFTHGDSVYTVKSDGSRLRLLAGQSDDIHDAAHSPSIAPDGSRIAYAAFKHDKWLPWDEDYRWDIVTSGLDGSGRRRLTKGDDTHVRNVNPAWSPDGTRIAFLSDRPTAESPDGSELLGRLTLYTMAPDGSDVRAVAPTVLAKGTTPMWSPDGRSLAFVAFEPDAESGVYEDVLYTVGADGSELARLEKTGSDPAWSPDGSRILFKGVEAGFYTAAPDGSELTRVTDNGDADNLTLRLHLWFPQWSPDGARILLSGPGPVAIVNSDGSGARWLTGYEQSWGMMQASWSPDGSRIAVYSSLDGRISDREVGEMLYTMSPDGSSRRILVRYKPFTGELPGGELEAAHGES